jgi:flagellar biogenesis protein FliO
MELLNKGLIYNLHHKPKNWLRTLAMQAEAGAKQLPIKEQNYMRQLVANNLHKLLKKKKSRKEKNSTDTEKREWNTIKI